MWPLQLKSAYGKVRNSRSQVPLKPGSNFCFVTAEYGLAKPADSLSGSLRQGSHLRLT